MTRTKHEFKSCYINFFCGKKESWKQSNSNFKQQKAKQRDPFGITTTFLGKTCAQLNHRAESTGNHELLDLFHSWMNAVSTVFRYRGAVARAVELT